MRRSGLFKKIFIYTFSVFSTLVICLHLAIYFLFPPTYLSHRQESIGQRLQKLPSLSKAKTVKLFRKSLNFILKAVILRELLRER